MPSTSTRLPVSRASAAGLILALGSGPVLSLLPGQAHQRITDVPQDIVIVVFEWVVALALVAIVVWWERQPLSSIGFRAPSLRDCVAFVVIGVGMYAVLAVSSIRAHAPDAVPPAEIAAVPLALRIVMFLTAGFCEEVMLRAYPIERLTPLTGQRWINGAIVVVFFTLVHLPRYGISPSLLAVAIIATFLTALYLWTRNFWMCATLHAFVDCLGLVVGPALAARGLL